LSKYLSAPSQEAKTKIDAVPLHDIPGFFAFGGKFRSGLQSRQAFRESKRPGT
jgi:hypothetical protein